MLGSPELDFIWSTIFCLHAPGKCEKRADEDCWSAKSCLCF